MTKQNIILPRIQIKDDYIYSNIEEYMSIEEILKGYEYGGAFAFTNYLYKFFYRISFVHLYDSTWDKKSFKLKAFTETEYSCYLINNGYTKNETT